MGLGVNKGDSVMFKKLARLLMATFLGLASVDLH